MRHWVHLQSQAASYTLGLRLLCDLREPSLPQPEWKQEGAGPHGGAERAPSAGISSEQAAGSPAGTSPLRVMDAELRIPHLSSFFVACTRLVGIREAPGFVCLFFNHLNL